MESWGAGSISGAVLGALIIQFLDSGLLLLDVGIGQRMIIINNLALFLLKTKGKSVNEEDKQQTIEEISSEATQAIEETREISYALRPFQLDRLGLSKAIQAKRFTGCAALFI